MHALCWPPHSLCTLQPRLIWPCRCACGHLAVCNALFSQIPAPAALHRGGGMPAAVWLRAATAAAAAAGPHVLLARSQMVPKPFCAHAACTARACAWKSPHMLLAATAVATAAAAARWPVGGVARAAPEPFPSLCSVRLAAGEPQTPWVFLLARPGPRPPARRPALPSHLAHTQ